MGAWRVRGCAAALVAFLHVTQAAAATAVEPIARLTLEGGYDSNVRYDGHSADEVGRVSPDVGLRLHDPTLDLRATYGGEWVRYQNLAPQGIWNHRGALSLEARVTRRTTLAGDLRASQAFDPAALAMAGVFRTGFQRAWLEGARARLEWRSDRLDTIAATYVDRTVLFDDRTGGAMHAPGVEALRRIDERFSAGVAYGFGFFQSFLPGADQSATSHAVRARFRWLAERHVALDAFAGPALWRPTGGPSAVVPEGFVEVLVATRGFDLRANLGHGLGIGATAQPGIVNQAELGFERRFGRIWFVRGDAGVWRSGAAPNDSGAVTGYAVAGEAGRSLGGGLRLSVTGAHYGRADVAMAAFRRSAIGLRLGWELKTR